MFATISQSKHRSLFHRSLSSFSFSFSRSGENENENDYDYENENEPDLGSVGCGCRGAGNQARPVFLLRIWRPSGSLSGFLGINP